MGTICKRYFKPVGGDDTEQFDYVVSEGKKFSLKEIVGSAVFSLDVKVELIWDAEGTPDLIFAAHGCIGAKCMEELSGDGTKVLRILLTNDSSVTETIGMSYNGEEY